MTATTRRPIALTPLRREALLNVSRKLVEYRVASADFVVEGVVVGGWDRRTYSDLLRGHLMTFTAGKGDRMMRLTTAGEKALEPFMETNDTTSGDTP